MQTNTFSCKDFFNKYIIEETFYKEIENNRFIPTKVYSRSTLGKKFLETDTITINRPTFNENIDYVKNRENNKTDDDIFKWLDIKINNDSATYLLDEWTTKDINEFAQVVKSFLLERVAI